MSCMYGDSKEQYKPIVWLVVVDMSHNYSVHRYSYTSYSVFPAQQDAGYVEWIVFVSCHHCHI